MKVDSYAGIADMQGAVNRDEMFLACRNGMCAMNFFYGGELREWSVFPAFCSVKKGCSHFPLVINFLLQAELLERNQRIRRTSRDIINAVFFKEKSAGGNFPAGAGFSKPYR